ncbi:MAG: alpha/beta hydrolase [Coriobacteriia bacterium]|nr:alpha/beta hydrolase [Coriobacteriia bacterium]
MPRPIVLVHGMFMTPLCWEQWVVHYEHAGRPAIPVAWPGRDALVSDLRAKHPDPELGKLTLTDVVEHLSTKIAQLPEKPLLIGHSMGGLIVQLLLQRDLALAGVAIDSAPPAGVFSAAPSFLKANWPMVDPFVSMHEPHMMSFDQFAYAFANTLAEEEQYAAYERYMVPESRAVPRESLGKEGHIDFTAPHPPLLLIAGGADHIIPPKLNESNFERYHASPGLTEYREYPGRDHLTILEAGWEELADYSLCWMDSAVK